MFKTLTGGDEMIEAEYKYSDGFSFSPYVGLIFSANQFSRLKDDSRGFFDRFLVVHFGRRFRGAPGEIPKETLLRVLTTPNELSRMLNRSLDGLDLLRKENQFRESESMKRAFAEFRAVTDPFSTWMTRHTVRRARSWIAQDRLWDEYSRNCERAGRSVMTKTAMTQALGKLEPPNVERIASTPKASRK